MSNFITLSGHPDTVTTQFKKICLNYKKVKVLNDFVSDRHRAISLELTSYVPEEEGERYVYGDPDHESYLLSDQYESDCKSERHDWVRKETS